MDSRTSRALIREARKWDQDGLLKEGALETIEGRYSTEGEGTGAMALYGLAGILVGAAGIATAVILDMSNTASMFLWLALAVAAVVGGAALARLRQAALADGMMAAALTLLFGAGAIAPSDFSLVPFLAAFAAISLVWARGNRGLVPAIGTIVFFPLIGNGIFETIDNEDLATTLFLVAGLAHLGTVVGFGRTLDRDWRGPASALAVVGVAVGMVMFTFEVIEPSSDGWFPDAAETALWVGAMLLPLLGAGIFLKEQGVVVATAAALAIDAIVFAFDIGGLAAGLPVLLGLAAALVWQARALRGYLTG